MQTLASFFFGFLGVFYMFGGYAVVRAIAMDGLIDTAIDRLIFLNDDPVAQNTDRFKNLFLNAMAIICFAGGAFLFFQSALATIFFCIALAMQLLHVLVLGPQYFDVNDGDDLDISGRRATLNAMLLYAVVTLFLLYAQYMGALPSFPPSWSQKESLGLALTIAFALYAMRLLLMSSPGARSFSAGGIQQSLDTRGQVLHTAVSDPAQVSSVANISELRVHAFENEYGLWVRYLEKDSWDTIQSEDIGLSVALELRISKWEDKYHSFWGMDEMAEPNAGPNWTAAERRQHFDEALAIARLLKAELTSNCLDQIKVSCVNEEGEILEI